jgi:FkbM family methyltransferase
MTGTRRPIDWRGIAIALAGVAVATAVFAAGYVTADRSAPPLHPDAIKRPVLDDELRPFVERLGEPRYSSHQEELFVRDFFNDKRDGVFVDVGAGHYRDRSNTYYLESELGWSGLAVEPLVEFAEDYRRHRPRTRFVPMFVSAASDEKARLYVGRNTLFSSANADFTSGFTDVARSVDVATITLDDLLAAERVGRIDFLSIDIELHEPEALAGFTIERHRPALVCIEAHPQVRQQILDYFTARGYVIVGKYLRADPQNLWFAPRASVPDQ